MSSELLYLGVGAAVLYFVTKKKPVPPAPIMPYTGVITEEGKPVVSTPEKLIQRPMLRDWYTKINPRTGAKFASMDEYLNTPLTQAEIAAMGGDGAYSRRRL